MFKRLIAIGVVGAAVAVILGVRRRSGSDHTSLNGGSRRQAAQLRRELERS